MCMCVRQGREFLKANIVQYFLQIEIDTNYDVKQGNGMYTVCLCVISLKKHNSSKDLNVKRNQSCTNLREL